MDYIRNKDKFFWGKRNGFCNCGAFALDVTSWFTPYQMGQNLEEGEYTILAREDLFDELSEDEYSEEEIMDTILEKDVDYMLHKCPWIELIKREDAKKEDRLIAYRIGCLFGTHHFVIDHDFHFRVRINGFWFEKQGSSKVRFLGTEEDTAPWEIDPFEDLMYNSRIVYFRFKKENKDENSRND